MPRVKRTVVCERCATPFHPFNGQVNARFCSRQCWLRTLNTPERNARIGRESAARIGDALRDRGEGRSYRKRNHRHEHRTIAEQKLGRALRPGEVVHHINGDKRDNRPENIEVLVSQAEHARLHMSAIKRLGVSYAA